MSGASFLANAARQRSRMVLRSPFLGRSAQTANATSVLPEATSFRAYSILATTTSSSQAPPSVVSRECYAAIPDSQCRNLCFPQRTRITFPFSNHTTCWMSTTASVMEDVTDLEEKDSDSEDSRLFSSLDNLNPRTLSLLERQGIQEMTEIQAKTWDAVSTGRDVVARSRTGSGKTLAFLLPSLEKIIRDKEEHGAHNTKQGIRVLIISPTRELASQIDKEASNLAKAHKKLISHQVLYGGVPKGKDMQAMDRRLPTILTATPGRLLDHLESSFLRDRQMDFSEATAEIDVLVLDEMDRLLDMGFSKDIRRIMQYLPDKEQRQTLLFSATVPPSVKQEIRFCTQKNALTVDCIQDEDPSSHTVNTVQQSYVALPHAKQITGVVEIILHLMNSASSSTDNTDATTPKIVVFFNTTSQVAYYSAILRSLGVPRVLEIHSKLSQESRSKTSDKFRNAPSMHASILLTSDVSARGVDYPNVTHVLQVGSATDRETYIHRLGRTGRAGKSGKGILVLVHPDEKVVLKKELGGMKIPLDEELHSVLANDGNESSSSGETEALLERLPGVLQSDALSRKAQDCYRSLLGFYMQRFKALNFRRVSDQVVDMINEFSKQALLKEKPGLSANAVRQHGLSRHPDISISKQSDYHHRGPGIDAGRGAYGGNQSHHRGGRGDNRGRDRGRSFDRYDSNGGRERSSNRGSNRRGRNEDRRGY